MRDEILDKELNPNFQSKTNSLNGTHPDTVNFAQDSSNIPKINITTIRNLAEELHLPELEIDITRAYKQTQNAPTSI